MTPGERGFACVDAGFYDARISNNCRSASTPMAMGSISISSEGWCILAPNVSPIEIAGMPAAIKAFASVEAAT